MKALIFDMDGVMIDSELHWQNDERALIETLLPNWQKQHHASIIGLSIVDIYKKLVQEHGLKLAEEDFMVQVDTIANRIYTEKTNLMPGCRELLEAGKGILPIAISSSARKRWIQNTLDRHDLEHFFDATVSFEDIEGKGKPAPDIYLHTANALQMNPRDCVVIEDSTNGILSAKAAGMFCIGLRNGFNKGQDLSGADLEIQTLEALNMKKLTNAFRGL